MKPHVMIDLETLGNQPQDGVIIAMAAIAFNMDEEIPYPTEDEFKGRVTPSTWYMPILALQQETDYKFIVDPETLRWWLDPSRVNQFAEFFCSSQRVSIETALYSWNVWLHTNVAPLKERQLWSHGVTFDCMHLSQKWPRVMAASFNDVCPFRNMRDTRTLFAIYEETYGKSPYPNVERKRHHHPLEDAWVQAVAVQNAWKGLMHA